MFYIKHNSDNFTIIDCCLPDDIRENLVDDIKRAQQGKGIVRFISTHPDEDHVLGLKHLDGELGLLNFYCVNNNATKEDESRTSPEGYPISANKARQRASGATPLQSRHHCLQHS
jgi:glyoxylase-like metal-dependent hydrolase (beta-lactamase superfamily II)